MNASGHPAQTLNDEQQRRLLDTLTELVEAGAEQRAAALAAAREQDPAFAAVLQRTLEHLEADAGPGACPPAAAEDADAAGAMLGPYRLIESIGRGGMGEVWRAERVDGQFEQQVAIKRLWGGPTMLAGRFLRERQMLARLRHPRIAQLLDGGVGEDGQPWFAMELVEGQPITRWCDARKATLARRVELVEQVCDAVEFAHRNLIVHRDIKPGNVLVDAQGNAHLLDFGIARLIADADAEQTQTLALTPAWAAPEHRRGEPVTTAADIWQLGALLRALLCGSPASPQVPPSRAVRELPRSDAAAAATLAEARQLAPDALARRLQGDLDAIVARATHEAPTHRYPSAAEMAADLRAWRLGQPVAARRHERGYQARRWARRWWPAMAAAVAGAAFLGWHVHSLQDSLQRETRARQQAVAAQQEAARQRDRAVLLADYFGTLFKLGDARGIDAGGVTAVQLLKRSTAALRAEPGMSPETRAELLGAAADAFGQLHRQADERDARAEAVRVLEQAPKADPAQLALAYVRAGSSANFAGDYATAQAWQDKAQALVARAGVTDTGVRVRMAQLQANQANARNDFAAAAAAYRQVIALVGDTPGDPRLRISLASAHVNLARLPDTPADASERHASLAEALLLQGQPVDHSSLITARSARMLALARLGRQDEAVALGNSVLEQARAHFTATDPWLAITTDAVARVAMARGDLDRAADLSRTAAQAAGGHFPPGAQARRRIALNAAIAQLAAGELAQGRQWLAEVGDAPMAKPAEETLRTAALALAACLAAPGPEAATRLREAAAGVQADQTLASLYPQRLWQRPCGG